VLACVFGVPPAQHLHDLGRALDSAIELFWSGERVISQGYPAAHLVQVAQQMGRKPFIWDNASANDSKVRCGQLFLDPTCGAWQLPADQVAGLAINPMNQPGLSCIALLGYRELLTCAVAAGGLRPPQGPRVCRAGQRGHRAAAGHGARRA
jgi:hyaluronoglucosaminidase